MTMTSLLIVLGIGAFAGWLAGILWKGQGFGLLGDIIIGIIGAVVGNTIFNWIGIISLGLIGSIITSTVGALIFLFLIGLIKRI